MGKFLNKLKIGAAATLASLVMFANTPSKAQSYSPITLQGTVWSAPTNNFPVTDVAVYDNDGMIFLGSTSTAPAYREVLQSQGC